MQLPNGNRMTLNVMESELAAGPIFKEDVRSSLPYVEIVTKNEYHYEGVMIDDQRILGFSVRFVSLCLRPTIGQLNSPSISPEKTKRRGWDWFF
jgi:hypothetical protein